MTIFYLVCTNARSGSGFLCDSLWRNELFGKPDEYFAESGIHPDYIDTGLPRNYIDYVNRVKSMATGRNGVCGIKIMWNQFIPFIERCRDAASLEGLSDYEVLQQVFPDVSFIWLTRRDKVRHAISVYKRRITGIISSKNTAGSRQGPLVFNYGQIDRLVRRVELSDLKWEEFFNTNSITPLRIVYEEYSEDVARTIESVAGFLDIRIPESHQFVPSNYRKLSDSLSEEWVRQYEAIRSTRQDGVNQKQ